MFEATYGDVIKVMQKGTWQVEDLVEKCGITTVQTAIQAAERIDGLGERADWVGLLEKSYNFHDVGSKLERMGKHLQRGETVDATQIVQLATRVADGRHSLVPLSEIVPGEVPFIETGWKPLDKHLGGIPEVGLITVGGNPGVGKTGFLIKLASKFVRTYKTKKVAIFTLEMILAEFANRALEIEVSLIDEEKSRIMLCEEIVTVGELANQSARIDNLGLVGVDFADLLVRGEVTESEMAIVYKALAALAKTLKVPVILLAQLNRVYQGGIPRPKNIRYTGLAEALSWLLLMLYSPSNDFYEENDQELLPVVPNKGYIIAWKCRGGFRVHGGPGAIQLNWNGQLSWGNAPGCWFDLSKGKKNNDEDDDE
jgi:hypothetical protein